MNIISKKDLIKFNKPDIDLLKILIDYSIKEANSKGYNNVIIDTNNYDKNDIDKLVKELNSLGYDTVADVTKTSLRIVWIDII